MAIKKRLAVKAKAPPTNATHPVEDPRRSNPLPQELWNVIAHILYDEDRASLRALSAVNTTTLAGCQGVALATIYRKKAPPVDFEFLWDGPRKYKKVMPSLHAMTPRTHFIRYLELSTKHEPGGILMDYLCRACPGLEHLTYMIDPTSRQQVRGSRLLEHLHLLTNLRSLEIHFGACSWNDVCMLLICISTSQLGGLERVSLVVSPTDELGKVLLVKPRSWSHRIPRLYIEVPQEAAARVAECIHVGVDHLEIFSVAPETTRRRPSDIVGIKKNLKHIDNLRSLRIYDCPADRCHAWGNSDD